MSREDFILKLSQEGREWAKILIPAFITWHLPQPAWVKGIRTWLKSRSQSSQK